MSNPRARRAAAKNAAPTRPEHRHGLPYDRLLTLGDEDSPAVYDAVAGELTRSGAAAGVRRLLAMALDETYYHYDESGRDPRTWTRVHAVCVLERMGAAAGAAVEPLLPLLEEEDDALREELPFFFASLGDAAVKPLTKVLNDPEASPFLRVGAAESLTEAAELHPDLRPRIAPLLEAALADPAQDDEVAAYLISNLLDLGAEGALPVIRQAFAEDRVDDTLVTLEEVEEHFGLASPSPPRTGLPPAFALEEDLPPDLEPAAEDDDYQEPFVAGPKIGRNDPCPCGSGKKYKKCCGAAVP